MKFEQRPDYKYLKSLFDEYFAELKFEKYDHNPRFDWVIQKEKIIEDKKRKEEEEKERAQRKKFGKNRPPNRREQQMMMQ